MEHNDKEMNVNPNFWGYVLVAGASFLFIMAIFSVYNKFENQKDELLDLEQNYKLLAEIGAIPTEDLDYPRTKADTFTGVVMGKVSGESYVIMQSIFGPTYPILIEEEQLYQILDLYYNPGEEVVDLDYSEITLGEADLEIPDFKPFEEYKE